MFSKIKRIQDILKIDWNWLQINSKFWRIIRNNPKKIQNKSV